MRYYTDWNHLPLLMDIDQAALLLQTTPENLRKLCRLEKFPAMQVGKEWRISRDVIREMAQGKGNRAPEDTPEAP